MFLLTKNCMTGVPRWVQTLLLAVFIVIVAAIAATIIPW